MNARPPDAEAPREGEALDAARAPALCCRACGHPLADPRDRLSVVEGRAEGAFVNPHGYVHDLLTLRCAAGMVGAGGWELAHTWFPGMAWQLGACGGCGVHVGWSWRSADADGRPPFVGLRRAAVRERTP